MFHGSYTVELRGAVLEVVYRRLPDGDIEWEFSQASLNFMRLTAQERRDIRGEILRSLGQ